MCSPVAQDATFHCSSFGAIESDSISHFLNGQLRFGQFGAGTETFSFLLRAAPTSTTWTLWRDLWRSLENLNCLSFRQLFHFLTGQFQRHHFGPHGELAKIVNMMSSSGVRNMSRNSCHVHAKVNKQKKLETREVRTVWKIERRKKKVSLCDQINECKSFDNCCPLEM